MLFRMALLAIALIAASGGCDFEHGDPGTSDSKLADGANADASPCAAIDIAAGGDHTCAIGATGNLYCWGRGDEGQIGIDPLPYRCTANMIYCQRTPAKVPNVGPMIAVGAGVLHTCSSTGPQAYCWGKNNTSQYGDNSIALSTRPKLIAQRAGATAFDGGVGHTCSLASGMLYCSGANSEGQIGNMSVFEQMSAVPVMNNVVSFSLGNATTCAIDTSKKLFCWGRNAYKTIDQTMQIKTLPFAVDGGTDVVQVTAGADHVCAAFVGGVAKCWGLNNMGQVGNGTTNGTTAQPMTALPMSGVVEVAASRNHTCVRTEAGDVLCFGDGYTSTPTLVLGGAIKVAAGGSHDCAVLTDGSIRCWGNQTYGQLGNNVDVSTRVLTPQAAPLCP
jgi:alpha-tubulin suppressor-like RCC1 family protein